MHGNAFQLVEDCYHDNYVAAPSDGSAWTSEDCSHWVARGGGFAYVPESVAATSRWNFGVGSRTADTGFRIARTLSQ
jgi:formylglycine-generating enzyme required for sulfatase activity